MAVGTLYTTYMMWFMYHQTLSRTKEWRRRQKMTTIAYSNGEMAVDSRITAGGDIVTDNGIKMYDVSRNDCYIKEDKVLVIALSGAYCYFDSFIDWMCSEREEEFYLIDQDKVSAIIVGQKWAYECEDARRPFCRYYKTEQLAAGSGATNALAALKLGLSVKDAVKHAMKMDVGTGGKIHVWKEKKRAK